MDQCDLMNDGGSWRQICLAFKTVIRELNKDYYNNGNIFKDFTIRIAK